MKNKLRNSIRAYAYCRYSSHNQDDGWSIEAQKAAILKYAKENGIQIVEFFIDEAATARNMNRSGYQMLMNKLENSDIKVLIVHKIDRMHRELENQIHDFKRLEELGVRFVATADAIDTNDPSTNLIAIIKAAIAEQYSVNLSAETRKGLIEAAKNGLHCGGKPPYGFVLNKDKYLEIDETTAPAIRQIFRMYLADMGYTAILKWLKDNNYRTSKGNQFTKGAINSILHNEKYCGVYVYDKASSKTKDGKRNSHKYKENYIRIVGGCPAIIKPEDFQRVQEKLKNGSEARLNYSTRHYYPLNGKVWNDDGTVRFSGSVNHNNGKKYYQYRSTKPGNKSVNADSLEEAAFFALRELLLSDDKADRLIDKLNSYAENMQEQSVKEYTQMKNKSVTLQNRLNNLLDRIESGSAPKAAMNRIKELENEINQLECQMDDAKITPNVFTHEDFVKIKKQFIPYIRNYNTLEAKELCNNTIDKIMIGDEVIDIKFRNGIEAKKDIIEFFE